MMKLAVVAAVLAAGVAAFDAGSDDDDGSDLFPGSRLLSNQFSNWTQRDGALINQWSNQSAGQVWALCYSTFTMDKNPGTFHSGCDQYKPTVTLVFTQANATQGFCYGYCSNNNGGCSPIGSKCGDPQCGPGTCQGICSVDATSCTKIGPVGSCHDHYPPLFLFGGYAEASWSGDIVHKATPNSFVFGLDSPFDPPVRGLPSESVEGPFKQPKRFEQPGQWAGPAFFPAWGGASISGPLNTSGLWIGGTSVNNPDGKGGTGPPGSDGFCNAGSPGSLCGGGNWGVPTTEMEVWRLATAEELKAASGPSARTP